MAHDHPKDICWLRAERHSQADFPRALRDQIRQDAEDSRGGKQQCNGGEGAEQEGIEAVVRGGSSIPRRHGAESGGGLVRIDRRRAWRTAV